MIKESKEATKGKETPLKFFEKCIANLAKKDSDSEKNLGEVVVIVNNPCLEFWFLLHFEPTAKCFSNCAGAEQALKKHLPNYEKKEKNFKKANNDIYVQLKPYLKTAIKNSAALGSFDPTEPQKAICEMGLFFECEELKKYFHKDGL